MNKALGVTAAVATMAGGAVAIAPSAGASYFEPGCNGITGLVPGGVATTNGNCWTRGYGAGGTQLTPAFRSSVPGVQANWPCACTDWTTKKN